MVHDGRPFYGKTSRNAAKSARLLIPLHEATRKALNPFSRMFHRAYNATQRLGVWPRLFEVL
jgi:hypothetical protein